MTGSPLATAVEAAIRRLRDVDGVRVRVEGDVLKEIHIETQSQRAAKPIVRDIQSVLRTELDLAIDHRIVSVAFVRPREGAASSLASQPALGAGTESTARPIAPATPVHVESPANEPSLKDERILFENVNLIVHGQRTQAQVELRWKGLPRVGNASGWGTRDESHRLVAQATTLAVQEFLADPIALNVREVSFSDISGLRVVVVVLSLLAHRSEKVLTGSCTVDSDAPQAVVLATLAALNRVVAGMRAKEPTEYVLRSENVFGG